MVMGFLFGMSVLSWWVLFWWSRPSGPMPAIPDAPLTPVLSSSVLVDPRRILRTQKMVN